MHLEAKNFLNTTRISRLKYVFIVFFKTNRMLKYTFFLLQSFSPVKKYVYVLYYIIKNDKKTTFISLLVWFYCVKRH